MTPEERAALQKILQKLVDIAVELNDLLKETEPFDPGSI